MGEKGRGVGLGDHDRRILPTQESGENSCAPVGLGGELSAAPPDVAHQVAT